MGRTKILTEKDNIHVNFKENIIVYRQNELE